MKTKQVTLLLGVILLYCLGAQSQTTPPFALMPIPRQCFVGLNGTPLSGGFIATYATGTTTPQATYYDSSGLYPQQNPVNLDVNGCASIWLAPLAYTIVAMDQNLVPIWTVNNVSDVGQLLYARAVIINPTNGVQQTIAGPLGASWFQGVTPHTTSPGVRVALFDPLSTFDTASNPPQLQALSPANPGQVVTLPDPAAAQSNIVLSPGPPNWTALTVFSPLQVIQPITNNPCFFQFSVSAGGTSGPTNPVFSTTPCTSSPTSITDASVTWGSLGVVPQTNKLDCTQAGISCIRNSYVWFEGGGCNNATSALGWDTFGTNGPTPFCLPGANVTKGVLALPAAATILQQNTGIAAASTTVTTTYPAATATGDLLEVEVACDTSRTVSGCTDGTNAYTRAANVTNSTYDLEVWYFNGNSTSMPAGTTLTCTLSAAGNAAMNWKEYSGILTASALDKTANFTGTGTAVTSGTTIGTTQNTELVIAAMAASGTPSVTGQSGWVRHNPIAAAGAVTVASEGLIQQLATGQIGAFTLGTSSTWASAIVTFKVSVGATATAQRAWGLPPFYLASQPVNASIKWEASQNSTMSGAVRLGATVACSADGGSDDPAFNTPSLANGAVNLPSPLILTTTSLPSLTMTGCAPSNLMHFQIQRLRYDPMDTFEGWVYVVGAGLQFGINQ